MKNLEKLTEKELIKIMNDEYHSLNEAATDEYERRFIHIPVEKSNQIIRENERVESHEIIHDLAFYSSLSAEVFPNDAKE